MNAPDAFFAQTSAAAARPPVVRYLALVCWNGELRHDPGALLLPPHIAERSMEDFWSRHILPKPRNTPRLVFFELTGAVGSFLSVPKDLVQSNRVQPGPLAAWLTSLQAPRDMQASPDALEGTDGAEVLHRCFAYLSRLGYLALDVPLGRSRGIGYVALSPEALRPTGQTIEITRDFDAPLGYFLKRCDLGGGERAAFGLAPA